MYCCYRRLEFIIFVYSSYYYYFRLYKQQKTTENITMKYHREFIKTVDPRYSEHGIFRNPRFFELFLCSFSLAMRKSSNFTQIIRTSTFRNPRFFEPILRSIPAENPNLSNFLTFMCNKVSDIYMTKIYYKTQERKLQVITYGSM